MFSLHLCVFAVRELNRKVGQHSTGVPIIEAASCPNTSELYWQYLRGSLDNALPASDQFMYKSIWRNNFKYVNGKKSLTNDECYCNHINWTHDFYDNISKITLPNHAVMRNRDFKLFCLRSEYQKKKCGQENKLEIEVWLAINSFSALFGVGFV